MHSSNLSSDIDPLESISGPEGSDAGGLRRPSATDHVLHDPASLVRSRRRSSFVYASEADAAESRTHVSADADFVPSGSVRGHLGGSMGNRTVMPG